MAGRIARQKCGREPWFSTGLSAETFRRQPREVAPLWAQRKLGRCVRTKPSPTILYSTAIACLCSAIGTTKEADAPIVSKAHEG